MRSQLRFLIGIIILLRLKLVLGNTNNACNCSCFLQPKGDDVCELIREVKTKTDNLVISQETFRDEYFMLNLELLNIIDERIKAYMDGNDIFGKAQKEEKSKIEEIMEFLCIFIIDTQMRIDAPSLFRTNLWISNLCSSKIFGSQKLSMPVTYKELEDLKARCPGLDSCEDNRTSDSLIEYNCQCGPLCSTLDTCCFDSPFLGLPSNDPIHSCQAVYGTSDLAYFMVDQCPRNGTAGDTWKTLCSKGEENNFMTYVPVTSKNTGVTYKNYYCFACHETTEIYRFWDVQVHSQNKIATFNNSSPILVFDSTSSQWTGLDSDRLNNESVVIRINKPSGIKDFVTECREDVISKCRDDWSHNISIIKCSSYTSLIAVRDSAKLTPYLLYKNPHCAICNNISLNDVYCGVEPEDISIDFYPKSYEEGKEDDENFKSLFSYTGFFTLSPHRCPENSIWNPFSRECSPLKCSEGYTLKNKACIPS